MMSFPEPPLKLPATTHNPAFKSPATLSDGIGSSYLGQSGSLSYLNGYIDMHMNALRRYYPLKSSMDSLKVELNTEVSSYSSFQQSQNSSRSKGLFRPYDLARPPLSGHQVMRTAQYLKELERGENYLSTPLLPEADKKLSLTEQSESPTLKNENSDSDKESVREGDNRRSPVNSSTCRPSSSPSSSSLTVGSPTKSTESTSGDPAPAQVTSSLTDAMYHGFMPPVPFASLGRGLPPPLPPFLPSVASSSLFMHRPEFPHLVPTSLGGPLFMSPSGNTGVIHPTLLTLGAAMNIGRRNDPTKPPPVKKYKCDVCGKAFSRSNTLVTHKRIHTGDKPFKCELCGRAFRQPGNLTRHRLTHTTVKPYICPQCNKAFNRASNLHTHMRTHTNYKPFVCQYCGKGFHQKIDMKIHSYTHTGEKPHKCKICGRGFKQLTHLTYHMRTHSDEKVYSCELCGKGFNQKGNLQAHIYGHTGERPHKCDICGKGFTLASTLNTHRRTHADKKPFVCQYCGKDFYQKTALKSHLVASHPYTANTLLL